LSISVSITAVPDYTSCIDLVETVDYTPLSYDYSALRTFYTDLNKSIKMSVNVASSVSCDTAQFLS
jgi:hypothetical protein